MSYFKKRLVLKPIMLLALLVVASHESLLRAGSFSGPSADAPINNIVDFYTSGSPQGKSVQKTEKISGYKQSGKNNSNVDLDLKRAQDRATHAYERVDGRDANPRLNQDVPAFEYELDLRKELKELLTKKKKNKKLANNDAARLEWLLMYAERMGHEYKKLYDNCADGACNAQEKTIEGLRLQWHKDRLELLKTTYPIPELSALLQARSLKSAKKLTPEQVAAKKDAGRSVRDEREIKKMKQELALDDFPEGFSMLFNQADGDDQKLNAAGNVPVNIAHVTPQQMGTLVNFMVTHRIGNYRKILETAETINKQLQKQQVITTAAEIKKEVNALVDDFATWVESSKKMLLSMKGAPTIAKLWTLYTKINDLKTCMKKGFVGTECDQLKKDIQLLLDKATG